MRILSSISCSSGRGRMPTPASRRVHAPLHEQGLCNGYGRGRSGSCGGKRTCELSGWLDRSCRLRCCPCGCELPRVADKKQDPDGYPVQVIANANGGREV